ncbi:MAG: magnesium transporter [Opitutaceae bacterium]|nr:magnesium transporter [Opitutaceae bacterium]
MSVAPIPHDDPAAFAALRLAFTILPSANAARIAATQPTAEVVRALVSLPPAWVASRLEALPGDPRAAIEAAAGPDQLKLWRSPRPGTEGTVGALMRPLLGVVPEEAPAARGVDLVRRIASPDLTYLYAVDAAGRLSGVVVLRDLFLAEPDTPMAAFMIRPPFYLTPEASLLDAMHAVVGRHYPVYPVCNADGTLLGLVRGHVLFENQVITITAQAGKLVGVTAAERTETSFVRSLRMRLPWLLVNLVMSLLSALVMLFFKHTLAQFIILAVFLTVVTTQGRNSGAQTMALVLRGITNGTWRRDQMRSTLSKEVLIGAAGGAIVGLLAAVAIWLEEAWMGNSRAPVFAVTVLVGMVLGCSSSCALGVAMPLVLRRLGLDPALAAGILLTNICTVSCQFLFLSLAVWWLV